MLSESGVSTVGNGSIDYTCFNVDKSAYAFAVEIVCYFSLSPESGKGQHWSYYSVCTMEGFDADCVEAGFIDLCQFFVLCDQLFNDHIIINAYFVELINAFL